jgi:VCBS repeat-containing protein
MVLASLAFALVVVCLALWWLVGPSSADLRSPLLGEELELRCVPATYLWCGSGAALDWTDLSWRKEPEDGDGPWNFANTYPGADPNIEDDVIFAAVYRPKGAPVYRFNSNCIIRESVTVHSITIESGYTGELDLRKTLTLSGSDGNSRLIMQSNAKISGVSAAAGEAKIVLAGKSVFEWRSGTLQHVMVDVQRTASTTASLLIAPNPGGLPSPKIAASTIDVSGNLNWDAQNVEDYRWPSLIHVYSGGVFNIKAAGTTFGLPVGGASADPNLLTVQNEGTVTLDSAGTATLVANYETSGITELDAGTLAISGTAEQNNPLSGTSWFKILNGSTIATPFLGIRDGAIIGNGRVDGNLILGRDPAATNYSFSLPTIAPGGGGGNIGTIVVTQNFHMYNGRMEIEIAGPPDPAPGSPQPFDRIQVGGYASFAFPSQAFQSQRLLEGVLLPVHQRIDATTNIPFLTYTSRTDDFTSVTLPSGGTWISDKNNTSYWFRLPTPNLDILAAPGRLRGRVFRDDGAVAGAFESGTEDPLVGVTVKLRDATGATVLATTTTDSEGLYGFDDLDPGVYVVEFVRPTGERLTIANAADDDDDSDADPLTGWAVVDVNNAFAESVFAGFYADTDPAAVDDAFDAHKNTAIAGTVLTNDTDTDDDALTVALDTDVSHGTLTLNSDGTFTYTPNTNYTGTDSFTYTVDDGYDGTDAATVTITIANTAAPVGANDTYTTPAGLVVEVAGGVLDNDTDQNNGTLVAVLATGPSHGALTLNADGSFVYMPDEDFVGTDSFAYRPSDDDGLGNLATVTISVTDHPPEAADDTETTNEDTAVAIDVLDNDADADNDDLAILGASDGVYGTVAIDDNGTANDPTDDFVVYTPDANFNGTDWFVYVIDDGYGRLSYATATVTVDPVNDAPDAINDTATAVKNAPVAIPVRANDTDADGDTLSVTGVTQGTHGAVSYTSTGVTYTPDGVYTGTDSFTYTVSDGHGGTDTATVNVTVSNPPAGWFTGFVWDDANANGIQDHGEGGLSSVLVQLLDSSNNVVASAYTVGGMYSIGPVADGDYTIRVVLPSGYQFSAQDQGSDDAVDSDVNSGGYSQVLTISGSSLFDIDVALNLI